MRLLLVTHHFFEAATDGGPTIYSSRIDPVARIAAVNAMLVSFHRHFGPRRHGDNPTRRLPQDKTPERVLDIVVLQAGNKGLIEHVGVDPSLYQLEIFDGPAMQLGFETQRVLRDRIGQYDYYAVVEDDMVVNDPLFFEKLAWFEREFGTTRMLLPRRYEMAQSGTLAMVAAWPSISPDKMRACGMRRDGQPERLEAQWHGRSQSFTLPDNPHVGGYFVSDSQLRHWAKTPWLYDRDASFIGPLESAVCLSPGRAFDTYVPAEPDPFFLSLEHWGTRYARTAEAPGITFGDSPLLEIALRALMQGGSDGPRDSLDALTAAAVPQLNALTHERDIIFGELIALRSSRSKLLKALLKATFSRR